MYRSANELKACCWALVGSVSIGMVTLVQVVGFDVPEIPFHVFEVPPATVG